MRVLLVLLFLIDWQPASPVSALPPPGRFGGEWAAASPPACEAPAPGWVMATRGLSACPAPASGPSPPGDWRVVPVGGR